MDSKKAICGICPGGCQVEVKMKNERIKEVKALKGATFSALCLRGRYAEEIVYSKDRIKKATYTYRGKGQGKVS